MTPDPALLAEFNAGVARARNAYTPDRVQWAPDCALPGCIRPTDDGRLHCTLHRRATTHTMPAPIERLADA